jgi:hypothetical protein
MINARFSAKSFEDAGYGSVKAYQLSRDLSIAIIDELDTILEHKMLEVIGRLNSMGHQLTADDLSPSVKSFYEPLRDDRMYNKEVGDYRFLIVLDVNITTGYPDTVVCDDFYDFTD